MDTNAMSIAGFVTLTERELFNKFADGTVDTVFVERWGTATRPVSVDYLFGGMEGIIYNDVFSNLLHEIRKRPDPYLALDMLISDLEVLLEGVTIATVAFQHLLHSQLQEAKPI